jgi:hypothetical protein
MRNLKAYALVAISCAFILESYSDHTNYIYNIESNCCSIIQYIGTNTFVEVPETIEGVNVVNIEKTAFSGNYSLTNIIMPDSIAYLGDGVFSNCLNLTAIYFKGDAPLLGSNVFYDVFATVYARSETFPYGEPYGGLPVEYWYLPEDDYVYENDWENTNSIVITGYYGSDEDLVILDEIHGRPVVGINYQAFYRNNFLRSVTIPDSVVWIGSAAFDHCRSLNSVIIGDGVTDIGDSAFSLCDNLTNVVFGANVQNIYSSAFSFCYALTSLTIPDSITYIGDDVCSYCTSLTNFVIGSGVLEIGQDTFRFCTSLPNITIPTNVTAIGRTAFEGCSSLIAINVDELNPNYSDMDGVLVNKSQTSIIQFPSGRTGSYEIPAGITDLADYSFGYGELISLTIPSGVARIGYRTFFSCKNLNDLTISDSVISIGSTAFGSCSGLTEVTIPGGITRIDEYVFSGCSALTNVVISDNITLIDSDAFAGCTSLASITLPDSITTLEDRVFRGCTSLSDVTLSDQITAIKRYAFLDCTSLTNLTIPASVTTLEDLAFKNSVNLSGIYFLGDVPSVAAGSFVGCDAAIIYRLQEASGWGTMFGGRPVVIWNPKMEVANADSGLGPNLFGFNISGSNDFTVVVEASTNLTTGTWETVSTHSLSNRNYFFTDPKFSVYPERFYRLRTP